LSARSNSSYMGDLSRASVLRRSSDTSCDRAPDHDASGDEIDSSHLSPISSPRRSPALRATRIIGPLLVRAAQQPLSLLEVEEVELLLRDPQPLEQREVIELFPLDCEREKAATDREVVVHRLR